MTNTTTADRAVDLLVEARSGAPIVNLPPELAPATIADAYAIQDATLDRLGGSGGWKVAPAVEGDPRCSALLASAFHQSGVTLEVPAHGFEIEVETAFVFGRDVSAEEARDPVLVEAAIETVHLAVELISSRYVDRKAVPVFTAIADLQNNGGVILGEGIRNWRQMDLEQLALDLEIDGTPQPLQRKNASFDQTLPALLWLCSHAASRGRGIRKGDVVITGARLGPVHLGNGSRMKASAPDLGAVLVDFAS